MRTTILVFLTVLLTLAAPASGVRAEDAAMVVDMSGGPAIYDSGDRQGREVMLMDFLARDTRIKLEKGSTLVLNYFASGAREEIAGPGLLVTGLEGSRKEGDIALKTAKVDYIPTRTLAGGGDAQQVGAVKLRGLGSLTARIILENPDETAVRRAPIVFRWLPLRGAESYQLIITEPDGRLIHKTDAAGNEYTLDNHGLKPGVEYVWKVLGLAGGKEIAKGEGRFFILDETTLNQVAHIEQYIKSNFSPESTEAKIALALLYSKYQLNDEARGILTGLEKDHPENRNIQRQLNSLKANYRPST